MNSRTKNTKRIYPQKYKSSLDFDSKTNAQTSYLSPNKVSSSKNKYDHQSQSVTLPGGAMRNVSDICDDSKPLSPRINTAYSIKINQLYKSKINCLPGTENQIITPKPNNHCYKNESNSLFYTNSGNSITNLFKRNNTFNVSSAISLKKQNPSSRNQIFNIVHQEKIVTNYKYYKNKSQITLS